MDVIRYLVAEPMVLLVRDLEEQGFSVSAVGGQVFGLMELRSPDDVMVGLWTDQAFQRLPARVIAQIVRAAYPYGFRVPSP
jgi:hypothetical protein